MFLLLLPLLCFLFRLSPSSADRLVDARRAADRRRPLSGLLKSTPRNCHCHGPAASPAQTPDKHPRTKGEYAMDDIYGDLGLPVSARDAGAACWLCVWLARRCVRPPLSRCSLNMLAAYTRPFTAFSACSPMRRQRSSSLMVHRRRMHMRRRQSTTSSISSRRRPCRCRHQHRHPSRIRSQFRLRTAPMPPLLPRLLLPPVFTIRLLVRI